MKEVSVKIEKKTAKKTSAKKTAVKKVAAKKTVAKKVAAPEKTVAKKTATKKSPAKKTAAKKVSAKKTVSKKIRSEKLDPTLQILKKCWQALDDKKAENLKVLDVTGKSPITNYFIIATANSDPHMKALSGEITKILRELDVGSVNRQQYMPGSGWDVVDAFDFMVHIFMPEQRELYGLESLWKDAKEINFK